MIYPTVVVIVLTFQRTEYCLKTIRSAIENLRYKGELLYYLADDGSSSEHIEACKQAFANEFQLIGWHTIPNGSYGANANKAWHVAHDHANITLWLEDDWELTKEFDLTPYVDLLENDSAIGMVRLGYLNLHMRGSVFGYGDQLYWLLERDVNPYVYTGHPSLKHRRFREDYGPYEEGLQPGETELSYAMQYRHSVGSNIVWPAALGMWGYWAHIGAVQSYSWKG